MSTSSFVNPLPAAALPVASPDGLVGPEQFTFLADTLPQLVWITDPAGFHTYFNQRWTDFTGYTLADSVGPDMWNSLLHPDDRLRAREVWGHSLATGADYEIEYRFKSRAGDYCWFLAQARPRRDAQTSAIVAWFGTCTDIDDQKKAEQQLRHSDERYQLAALATNDAIWDWDLITESLHWNPAIERVFGFRAADLYDSITFWYEHIHPDDAERVVHGIHAAIGAGRSDWQDEYRFRRADGSYAQVLDRGHVARDPQGRALRMIGAMADVTRQRQAEGALTRREAEFTTLADNMAQLAWMTRPNGHIYWYNKRWYDYTGTTLAEMEGWGWEKVHHPDHIAHVVDFVSRAWVAGQPFELTFPLRGRDGAYRWFLTRAEPIRNEQGELVRWLGTNTDVTAMRELQEQLESAYSDLEAKIMFRTLDLEREIQTLKQQASKS